MRAGVPLGECVLTTLQRSSAEVVRVGTTMVEAEVQKKNIPPSAVTPI
jgi:hypothetical protein